MKIELTAGFADRQLFFLVLSLNQFLAMIHKQAILDTALDMMSINLDGNHTYFEILRQASIANKIAFNLDGQNPLGGVIKIELSGEDLPAWIEAATSSSFTFDIVSANASLKIRFFSFI
mgnify:CR=1 FL=1